MLCKNILQRPTLTLQAVSKACFAGSGDANARDKYDVYDSHG
jgi:hypothetical protein